MTSTRPSPTAFTLQQAAENAPALAHLTALLRESAARLKAVEPLIPPMLRAALQPGPVDGAQWCLLVDNTAAAAKLRQLLPALAAHLRTRGWPTEQIRVKVRSRR